MTQKRLHYFLIVPFFVFFLITSCTQEVVTYGEILAEQKTIIDNFIKEKGFIILKEYPEDGIFKEKEYVLLDNGVYLHVIDSGNGIRPVEGTEIQTLAKGYVIGDSTHLNDCNGFDPDADKITWPLKFTYEESLSKYSNKILGVGYMRGIDYVGNNSYVSMIIPFEVGSLFQYYNYCPMYFEKIFFSFKEE